MNGPQIVGQRAQLRLVDDVALEEDIARRFRFREKGALVRTQGFTGKAEDDRLHACNLAPPGPPVEAQMATEA